MGLLSNALDALFKKRTNAASLSGAMVPIVTNVGTAGNPQYAIAGIDSMPNLASVLGAANLLARLTNFKVAETTTGDLNELKTGIIYCGNPTALTNAPSDLIDAPTFFVYVGLNTSDRGIQLCFHVPQSTSSTNNEYSLYMRGQTYLGWLPWRKLTFAALT